MSRWRVGRKLGRTLYRDEVCVGMVDTPEIAEAIIAAMNGTGPRARAVPRGHCDRCDRCGCAFAPPHGWYGCLPDHCSMSPLPAPRSICIGCGAPYEA